MVIRDDGHSQERTVFMGMCDKSASRTDLSEQGKVIGMKDVNRVNTRDCDKSVAFDVADSRGK